MTMIGTTGASTTIVNTPSCHEYTNIVISETTSTPEDTVQLTAPHVANCASVSMSDFFGGLLLAVIAGAGLYFAGAWGLSAGVLVACLLLANQLAQPIAEIGEVLDQTQTALAGWGKILGLLDQPVQYRGNAQCPHPARGLGNIHRAHRRWQVLTCQQGCPHDGPVHLQPVLERSYRQAIDPRCATVANYLLIRRPQIATLNHGLHQP